MKWNHRRNKFIYDMKPYNKWIHINPNKNEITFPKEFTCNPSLTAEVLINFMRESEMLLSSPLILGYSKNRLTSRQRADFTSLGKTLSRKEPGFFPCLVLYSSLPMWRVFPLSSCRLSQESTWYARKNKQSIKLICKKRTIEKKQYNKPNNPSLGT